MQETTVLLFKVQITLSDAGVIVAQKNIRCSPFEQLEPDE